MSQVPNKSAATFHAMAKPSGPDCNLHCAYCFYLEKKALYPAEAPRRMSLDTLEAYVRNYIASHPLGATVTFAWQGGEPTLMSLAFYEKAVELQRRYGGHHLIANTFQTNGLLIDDNWAAFFAKHDFLVGLSLDGPADVHDRYRLAESKKPSHALVMRALGCLKRHRVRFNVLACINRHSANEGRRVYQFFLQNGVQFIQFIPVIEREPSAPGRDAGLALHGPGGAMLADAPPGTPERLTDWSVRPEGYSRFLKTIFDRWVRHDVGNVFVMNFEWALANFMGEPGAGCHHRPVCGTAVVVEHNGDVFSCDHYVYPEYRLGNLKVDRLDRLLSLPAQQRFGQAKYASLPTKCRECRVLRNCWGGCPKHRFTAAEDGEPGLNYLCAGYYDFFTHATPYFEVLAHMLRNDQPAGNVPRATPFKR